MSKDSRPVVLVTEGSDPVPLKWLYEQANVTEIAYDDPGFAAALPNAEALVVRTYTRVNDALLDQAPKLKAVGRGGVGLENIDVKACRRRGVEVVYTPSANTLAVADFCFGYMLQMLRPWCFFRDQVYTPKEFKRLRNDERGVELHELTLGILGMGRVGRRVAKIATAGFGMKVIYNDIIDVQSELDFPATPVDKETLYHQSDVLSLHVTMIPGNENMIGAEQIAMMKPTAILVNTARGEVLDAHALAAALKANKIAGAAIDVYSPEPPTSDFPLLGLKNALLTPHLAARTNTALENIRWVVRDVIGVLKGEKPRFPAP